MKDTIGEMGIARLALSLLVVLSLQSMAADPPTGSASSAAAAKGVKIKPRGGSDAGAGLIAPDIDLVDVPTSAVLDYGGYSTRSRFAADGGLLQYVSFGVYQGVNIGGSLAIDGLIGNNRNVRVRSPNAQVKWHFYDGDRQLPSLALGYDGQGNDYNNVDKRYNNRQRGFYVVATQELGLPGLQAHPSINISDFDSNAFFGVIPFSYNIKDKVLVMLEWDNINNFIDSRLNSGLRVYVTPRFGIDFAIRGIGQGGVFNNGDSRGPERIVQLKYSASF